MKSSTIEKYSEKVLSILIIKKYGAFQKDKFSSIDSQFGFYISVRSPNERFYIFFLRAHLPYIDRSIYKNAFKLIVREPHEKIYDHNGNSMARQRERQKHKQKKKLHEHGELITKQNQNQKEKKRRNYL